MLPATCLRTQHPQYELYGRSVYLRSLMPRYVKKSLWTNWVLAVQRLLTSGSIANEIDHVSERDVPCSTLLCLFTRARQSWLSPSRVVEKSISRGRLQVSLKRGPHIFHGRPVRLHHVRCGVRKRGGGSAEMTRVFFVQATPVS